jgi:hypothetical protein
MIRKVHSMSEGALWKLFSVSACEKEDIHLFCLTTMSVAEKIEHQRENKYW